MILHTSYVNFMAEAGLSRNFFSFFVKGASDVIELPEDAVQATITQSEIRLDQMRIQGLVTETSLTKST